MHKQYKIVVAGIGGVGGYIGGKLAAAYAGTNVEIVFVARGNNGRAIANHGLRLMMQEGEMTVRPGMVTDDAATIGTADVVICCTKAYDLEETIKGLLPAIAEHTLVLPLLNGADIAERVEAVLPTGRVLHGCIYLVAKLLEPGVVQQRGVFHAVHFGGDKAWADELNELQDVLTRAGINAVHEEHITTRVWSKFSFISPIATYTSAHNVTIGSILASDEHRAALRQLMEEVVAVAAKENIELPADTVDKNFETMEKLPPEATSSMQADFAAGKQTELETLTGAVVRKATAYGIAAPSYNKAYAMLQQK